jgi:hypothetical protein
MADIVFDCVCGRHYTASQTVAGRPFVCKQCRRTIQIPVPTPVSQPASSPAPTPQSSRHPPIPIPINTTASSLPQAKRSLSFWYRVTCYVVVGVIVLGLILFALNQSSSDQSQELKEVGSYLLAIPGIALVLIVPLAFIMPLVLPALLSRKGFLSVGRWASLAGFFLAASCGLVFCAYHVNSPVVNMIGGLMWTVLFGSGLGCFLASAIYPKEA